MKVLIWVQSLVGNGHLRRTMSLAEALAKYGLEITLVNGGVPPPWPVPSCISLLQLPVIMARSGDFTRLLDQYGLPVGAAVWEARQRALGHLLERLPFRMLITEMFPFGRKAFRAELEPVLASKRSRRPRPLTLASVRDVLVSKPDASRHRWSRDLCLAYYDRILVHGDEQFLPFSASFPFVDTLAERVVHTGFIKPNISLSTADLRPSVVVSAGGGAVGAGLLRTALVARALTRFAQDPWLVVGGTNLPPASMAELAKTKPFGVTLARHRDDLPALMAQADVCVSQAGYNTVVEGLGSGARMVLVPFASASEDEQERRARRLSELRLAIVILEEGMTPRLLADAINAASELDVAAAKQFSFDGADRSARLIVQLLEQADRDPAS